MNKQTQAIENDLEQLARDAGTLIAATAGMAGEQVGEARKRLTDMLDRGKGLCELVRDKALERTRAADVAIHQNLYQTIAIGFGVGIVMGCLLASRCTCRCVCSRE